nr:hypothetical transcript [Hymenolepis microstoma]
MIQVIQLPDLGLLVHCHNEYEKWNINEDISRLLSSDDTGIFPDEGNPRDFFNSSYRANFTSSENASYWHPHADAPVLEQSPLDALQTPQPTHCIPWVCGIALNTLQLVFLNETTGDLRAFHYRGKLLRGLIAALPVTFAVINICVRLWKFQGHRLHLPSLSRVAPSYSCQQECTTTSAGKNKRNKVTAFSAHTDGAGPTCIALFSSNVVSAFHLVCSFMASVAVCLQITSISLSHRHIPSQIQAIFMHAAVGLFYTLALIGYSSRLTLASAITTRNSYNPGEMINRQEKCSLVSKSDNKLTPTKLLEIPKFTRTQFFDTTSPESNHCVTASEPVQFIAVYKPVVS